ncbi:DUF3999 family protein [uncultured Fibrella sp.]|uniref:DUF3999 family protein n=1 Tax=uncultured Fibrella sp. TaxID=1284596 RepID=UPI0035CB35D1
MKIPVQILGLCFFLPACTLAQSFSYKAPVSPVTRSGYHRIGLSPDVVGQLQDGLGDIRLFDGQKREVPYILTRQTGLEATAFIPFEVVKKTNVPSVKTTVIVKRPSRQPIQSISVDIQNTNVLKKATLSGSNDASNWYALDDAVQLGRTSNATTTSSLQTISFPLSDYTYFRLEVNDSTSAPLNLVRIGSFGQTGTAARFTKIPDLRFTQIDSSDHNTYLVFSRPTPARIDRLTIRVSQPAQFRRQASVGHNFSETIVRKRRSRPATRQSFDPLIPFAISSSGDTIIYLPGLRTDKLCIRIANGDDPPLQIRSIGASQLTTYLTANLLADSTYHIEFGDQATAGPVYDLAYFKNQLSGTLPVVAVGAVTAAHEASISNVPKANKYTVWAATIVILLLLGAMTYRLLKETPNRQTDA